jgi:hypothetical protein
VGQHRHAIAGKKRSVRRGMHRQDRGADLQVRLSGKNAVL